MTGDRQRLGGYLLGRAIVLFGLLPFAAYFMARFGEVEGSPFSAFFILTATAFALTLGTALLQRRGAVPDPLLQAQPAWDVLYTTGLLYISGGWRSPFIFLYLLAIVGAAILTRRRGALVTATATTLTYGVLTALQVSGVVAPKNPFPLEAVPGSELPLRFALHTLAFYTTAILSGHLAEELRKADERLERAQDEIRELETLQESILSSMGAGLVALDLSRRPMFFNPSAEEMLGKIGADVRDPASLEKIFEFGTRGRREARHEATGTVLGYTTFPLRLRKGKRGGMILSFQDLTEVRKLEEGLKQADRLAAVGRLAAGLAHEVRNPLASLSGSVQMLEGSLASPDDEQAKLLAIILRETERLNRLVTDFLHYARPGQMRREDFDFHAFVDEMGFFFKQGEGREGFTLLNDLPTGETFSADRGQLEQLLLNLFRNAVEASPHGVTVTVRGGRASDAFVLEVADDGPGMEPSVAARAFEPFVSTKEGGTGLGLATVHRIAQNHGGTVELDSTPGGGARFRICLALEDA